MLVGPVTHPAVAPKETGGSPEFPGYPFEHMPRSQNPVVPHPLALARTGLLPSNRCRLSALGPVARPYPLTTTIHLRSSMTRPAPSPSLCFAHRHFGDRTSVRLSTWWLALGRVGLFTHWVTMTIFKGVTLFHHPGLTLGTSTVLVRCPLSSHLKQTELPSPRS